MMKKIFFIIIISMFAITSFSQTKEISKIIIHSVGNNKIINGNCKITFNKLMKNDEYYVSLTPINQYAELYISNKTNNSFIVKSKSNKNIEFNYIIFLKRTKKIIIDSNKK